MPAQYPDFFATNMKLLKKSHPHIWEIMTTNTPEPEGEIILAPNGEPNLWTKDINGNRVALHIPKNPGAEANDIAATVIKNFDGTLILTGMGLGYSPLAIIELYKNLRHLIIFEPNAGIFLQALKAMDLSSLFFDPKVILGIGENQNIAIALEPATKALQLESIQHIKHNPSFSLNFPKYNSLYEKIDNHTASANIEGNTFLKTGNDFFTNRLRHLNSIHHNYLFDDLKGVFKGKPAIMVSAGPSLDKNIHILKKAEGKAVILAVDSALPSLIANNIMPDFVTTIDPLELIFEKVATAAGKINNISLICMSWASSKMAKLFPAKKIFWCFGAKPIEQWMTNLIGCKTLTAGASTVAHLNFTSAVYMGCSPIVFMGQDLSFAQSKSHSTDMALPIKDIVKETLKNDKTTVWLDGINGGKVPSNRGFHKHKLHFEEMLKKTEGCFINATEGGCHIKGTDVMPLQEVIDKYCLDKYCLDKYCLDKYCIDKHCVDKHCIDKYCLDKTEMTKISNLSAQKDPAILREHLINKLLTIIKKCREIQKKITITKNLLSDLFKILKKAKRSKILYKSLNELPVSGQKKLLKLDKIGKQLDNADDIWPLMQEVTMAGLKQSERLKHDINLLDTNPENYFKWLKKNLQRLETINKIRKEVLPLFADTLQEDVNFLKSEKTLLTTVIKQKDIEKYNQQLLKIISLYFDAGNIALAQPWLKKLSKNQPDSGMANLFQGITAAHYTQYDKAESFFQKAIQDDPACIDQIKKFREQQGTAYISYAQFFDDKDKAVARRLLLKGLTYSPEHEQVQHELKLRCDQALKEIKKDEKEKTLSNSEDMIDSWLEDISSTKALSSIIGNDHTAKLHYYKGTVLLDREEIDNAIEHFNKAVSFIPDNPKFHISLTDACFAKNDYPKSIEHLNQAVALDKAYAVYWEEIGDQLINDSQHEDAIIAFEKCFISLPQRVHLLKKIGDCYQKTGQLEAAKEAYTTLNSLLKES